MKFAEFKNQIQNAYASKFPESLCDCSIHNSFGGFISINCFLGASREEFQNYISQNDAINIRLNIDLPKNAESWNMETELPDVLTITVSSHAIKHKPPEEAQAAGRTILSVLLLHKRHFPQNDRKHGKNH